MGRQDVYREIEQLMGVVPQMFKELPDNSIEQEWELFKKTQIEETAIPAKYRELIGVAISAATKCKYCSYFHTEMAKLFGATNAEIEDAVHFAKASTGWSTYLNGMQLDFNEFKSEIDRACEHIRQSQMQPTH
jgi:AhpD family alkylhydroperoxidase